MTILVIEDDEGIRSNLLELLEAEGFDALGAADGSVGLRLARERRPAIIICDLRMPVVDGQAVLAEVRADPALRRTRVIVLTANAELSTIDEEVQRQADDVVVKPYSRRRILDVIRART